MICGTSIGVVSAITFAHANIENNTYTLNDVCQHNTINDRIWVTFEDGVYDITDFISNHVGGKKYIELVAGGRLEPFWKSYNFHLKNNIGKETLEPYRIGDLAKSDQITNNFKFDERSGYTDDPFNEFANEPFLERPYDELIVMRMNPFLSEVKNDLLTENFFTPNQYFYTRNHFPVPTDIKQNEYKLDLHLYGDEINPDNLDYTKMCDEWDDIKCNESLSLNDIKSKFENVEVIATLQCGGNRGGDFREPAGLDLNKLSLYSPISIYLLMIQKKKKNKKINRIDRNINGKWVYF